MGDLELDPGTGSAIARRHRVAARRIGRLEQPPAFDAGPAAGDLLTILARLLSTAAQLARANALTATVVRGVADDLGTTDAQVEATFEQLRSRP